MAKWIKYSAQDSEALTGFVDLDQVGTVVPSMADGTWYLRVTLGAHNYTIATGSGDVTTAIAAFEAFLAGDILPTGA
jgi:hypothetical protein